MTHYYKVTTPDGNCRVYSVPAGEAVCREYVETQGLEIAHRWDGVWQIQGAAVIRDARYREILENTPEVVA